MLLGIVPASFAQTSPVRPVLNCVAADPWNPGWYLARFGYENPTTTVSSVPINSQINDFWVNPGNNTYTALPNGGQPTTFQPGIHEYEFSYRFQSGQIVY